MGQFILNPSLQWNLHVFLFYCMLVWFPREQFYLECVNIIFSKPLKIFVYVIKFSENRILKTI